MIDAPLALAFTAGMVATVNPCGFAMLPAYLSYFLGIEGDRPAVGSPGLGRAVWVGGVVALGFVVVFGIAGALFAHFSVSLYRYAQWLTIVIGLALAGLGVHLVRGAELSFRLPRWQRGGTDRGVASMFLFGVTYAIASLSCTLPIFIVQVVNAFTRDSYVDGLAVFVAYAGGMAVVLVAITIALALARQSLVTSLRRLLPYVSRISGGLLVVTGLYVAWYGLFAIRTTSGGAVRGGGRDVVGLVEGWSTSITAWVVDVGATRIGVVLAVGITASVAASRRRAT